MSSRRKFIKNTALVSSALLLNPLDLIAKDLHENNIKTVNKPLVLSTWNFGLKANEEAWTILGKVFVWLRMILWKEALATAVVPTETEE